MADCSSLDDFRRCNVDVLRQFLKERGVHFSSYNKEELLALSFVSFCQKLPVIRGKEDTSVSTQYSELLMLSDGTIRYPIRFVFPTTRGFMKRTAWNCGLHAWYSIYPIICYQRTKHHCARDCVMTTKKVTGPLLYFTLVYLWGKRSL